MKSLVSFARSSQARAFARQYSGSNTPAVFFHWSSNAGSSRRGAAGFRLVQKMAASKIPKKGPALFFIQKLHIADAGFVCSPRSARLAIRRRLATRRTVINRLSQIS
jgi:hypothetical protein